MKFVVGSRSPAKLRAVEEVAGALFPGSRVEGVEVDSGVAAQPRSDAEAIRGAEQRARAALDARGGTLGVGIESGVMWLEDRLFALSWVAVRDAHGRVGLGCSPRLELPPGVAAAVEAGAELREAMHRFGAPADPGPAGGAMGVLTTGRVTRESAMRDALHCALARFRQPDLYRG